MDRLREIEVFVRVVETGSFTGAARSLGLSKASATTLVQSLESRLQIKLLHRTTRRVSATEAGPSTTRRQAGSSESSVSSRASSGSLRRAPRARSAWMSLQRQAGT